MVKFIATIRDSKCLHRVIRTLLIAGVNKAAKVSLVFTGPGMIKAAKVFNYRF